MCSCSMISRGFWTKTSGDITCVCVCKCWVGGRHSSGEGSRHGDSRQGCGVFSSEFSVCKFSRTHVSMLWSSITWTTFTGVKAVLVRRGQSGNTPVMYCSNVELGRCFLSFNLHVVKTISGALCCLYASHECSPCESLMYLIC